MARELRPAMLVALQAAARRMATGIIEHMGTSIVHAGDLGEIGAGTRVSVHIKVDLPGGGLVSMNRAGVIDGLASEQADVVTPAGHPGGGSDVGVLRARCVEKGHHNACHYDWERGPIDTAKPLEPIDTVDALLQGTERLLTSIEPDTFAEMRRVGIAEDFNAWLKSTRVYFSEMTRKVAQARRGGG